jgi:plastocyanin
MRQQQQMGMQEVSIDTLAAMAPMLGYLEAHRNVEAPYPLLGGPIRVRLRQDTGGVHVALPAYRELDPRVFGTPELPMQFAGSPIVYGVPPQLRDVEGGRYTRVNQLSPFGDNVIIMRNATMELEALDMTATDAAMSRDSVRFEGRWQDTAGNTYAIRCTTATSRGVEYPVFGGVVTNHILHGVSRVGTPLMPTQFAYVAFWGMGEVLKNDSVVDGPVMVHGMYTELVRGENYRLLFDNQVIPTQRHFHIIVPPVTASGTRFEPRPVNTGFTLPNGETLPFWHVMFRNVSVESGRADGGVGSGDSMSPGQSMEASSVQGSGNTANGAEASTTIGMTDNLRYSPAEMIVTEGRTVRWVNTSRLVHTVTADSSLALNPEHVKLPEGAQPFNSGNIAPGDTYEHTFSVAGEYRYFCIPHEAAGMVGELTVVPKK